MNSQQPTPAQLQELKKILHRDRGSCRTVDNYLKLLESDAKEICQLFSQPEVKGWEDTVLGDDEILEASQVEMIDDAGNINMAQGYLTGRKQVAKAQARHTASLIAKQEREAGKKEVVEWVNLCVGISVRDKKEWQAFVNSLERKD